MQYGLIFTLLGASWLFLAAQTRGIGWLMLWPAVAFLAVGAAYLGVGVKVFGKRSDGSMSPVHLAILLPYVCLAWSVWRLLALLSNESPANEVAPGIWIGRRPRKCELPPGVKLVVDLTCELWESRGVRGACDYLSCPTLDAGVPDLEKLSGIRGTSDPILIQCAQGHGRSAWVAALLLMDRGIADNADVAIRRIAAARPRIRINAGQMQRLRNEFDV